MPHCPSSMDVLACPSCSDLPVPMSFPEALSLSAHSHRAGFALCFGASNPKFLEAHTSPSSVVMTVAAKCGDSGKLEALLSSWVLSLTK